MLCIASAVVYGIVHDQVTARILRRILHHRSRRRYSIRPRRPGSVSAADIEVMPTILAKADVIVSVARQFRSTAED